MGEAPRFLNSYLSVKRLNRYLPHGPPLAMTPAPPVPETLPISLNHLTLRKSKKIILNFFVSRYFRFVNCGCQINPAEAATGLNSIVFLRDFRYTLNII